MQKDHFGGPRSGLRSKINHLNHLIANNNAENSRSRRCIYISCMGGCLHSCMWAQQQAQQQAQTTSQMLLLPQTTCQINMRRTNSGQGKKSSGMSSVEYRGCWTVVIESSSLAHFALKATWVSMFQYLLWGLTPAV